MLFKKKNVERSNKTAEVEAMLLNMVQDCGLALSPEEKKGLESSGWVDTGKYNGHGQPLVKNVKTGEVLSVCRGYPIMSTICNVCYLSSSKNNPCGTAY